jgi:hypothetical protein|tara:strand:- start:66 stop:935 length:870 start_codon:yes stop_codon:yes gene_type:complete
MANVSQQEEPKANPYNRKKDWHKQDEKAFVSSNSLFFEEPESEEAEGEATTVTKKPKATRDRPYKKPDYKKRYDDLKAHYDSKLNEFKEREQELLDEATKNRPSYVAPKSPEDLEKFRKQYPDVYEVVETVAHMQSSEKTKSLEEKLAILQERETDLITRQAHERLLQNHPDFEEIRNDDGFHSWAKEQPQSIQDWIYKNNNDGDLASRALDLYKRDLDITTSSRTRKPYSKKSKKSAADMVSTKTTAVEPKQDKIWTEREIAAMSIHEFDKFEDQINQAISEGRVVKL